MFPILRKQPEGEILRKLLKVEWFALWFETADEQSAALVPEASATGISSAPIPKTRESDACRRMWVRRSGLVAMLRLPVCFQPVACPVSASSEEYSSTLCCTSRVRLSVERSCRTCAAECHVVPLVSLARSSRMTSRQPFLVRW